jgi:hypothetical protein
VPAGEHGDKDLFDDTFLTDDHVAKLVHQVGAGFAEAFGLLYVVLGRLNRRHLLRHSGLQKSTPTRVCQKSGGRACAKNGV